MRWEETEGRERVRLVGRNVGSSCFWSMGTMRSQAVRKRGEPGS